MRERLLEGLVRRLARTRDADAYALRGGMAIRAWLPGRVPRDVDLVCRLPYSVRELTARLREALAQPVADGIAFDEELRVDPYVGSPRPGLQVFARGTVDDRAVELAADLTFDLAIWPDVRREAGTWTCPHEMVIATKLDVLGELGPRAWRTKDLADLWGLLRRFSPGASQGEAFERFTRDRDVLARTWWSEPAAADRWARFAAQHPEVPATLDAVIAEVRDQLSPFARKP